MGTNELALSGQALIEDIRRNDYMIGLDMPQEVEGAANSLRGQLNNALRLLSEDLYASDTHFLLELLQNADDNSYAPDVVPSVQIKLSQQRLTFFNNEVGFAEKNVRALCGVGRSTKAADKKSGFIGEKGIGFKSVFQVSNKPEIHSNGFHFSFDMSRPEELLGYVVPNWTPPDVDTSETGTTVVLPAKAGRTFSDSILKELHPKLMLFLRRLRHLDLAHETGRVVFERRDSGNVISIITEQCDQAGSPVEQSTERYMRFVHRVSMAQAADEKRPDAIESDLVLAFPLDAEGKALAEAGKEVFSFLPIRAFGFRFYIQGDFLLSSSREDIHGERPWNQKLRDSIAPAFVRAIEQFRKAPSIANGYLNYLPKPKEVTAAFFVPVVDQLFAALSETECIPCATGVWRKPSEVMLPPPRFAELVSAKEALALFGKDYPAASLTVDNETLGRLGCKALTYDDLVNIFKNHTAWLQQRKIEWMLDFYRFIAGLRREDLLSAGFAKAPVVLDAKGAFRSANSTRVFYPLAPGKRFGFEHELTLCHEAIARATSDGDKSLQGLFDAVGVKSADPYQLITEHILPLHEKDDWKQSGNESLVGHLRYIKEKQNEYLAGAKSHGTSAEAAWEKLKTELWVGTKNRTFWQASQMYLSSEYQPEFDIESLLGDGVEKSRLVSPLYLKSTGKSERVDAEEIAGWRTFLIALGVNPSPRVDQMTSGDLQCSAELQRLLEAPASATRRVTLECLDRNWSRYPSSPRFVPKGKPSSAAQIYGFVHKLRVTVAPSRKRVEVTLEQAFRDSKELREAFGDSPHYVDAQLSNEAFLDACGILHRPDVQTCVARLLQLQKAPNVSMTSARPIYRFLERLYERNPDTVRQAFRSHALFLVRGESPSWKNLSQVVWLQQGEFLSALYPSLQGAYAEFQSFFVRKLGVSADLPTIALIRALPSLDTSPISPESRAGEAMRIYTRANREIVSPNGDESMPAWLDEFADGNSFLSTSGEMVANDGELLINDDPNIAALFHGREGIHFVDVPVTRLPQIRALLDAARVPTLSSKVSLRLVDPGPGVVIESLTSRVAERCVLIARVVYANSHAAFTRAVENGKWNVLSKLVVSEVGNLNLHAELLGEVATTTGHVLIDGSTAYVRTGVKGLVDRLAAEICTLLSVSPILADAISRILSEPEFEGAAEFLEVKGVTELPTEEAEGLFSDHRPPPDEERDQPEGDADTQDDGESEEFASETEATEPNSSEPPAGLGTTRPSAPASGGDAAANSGKSGSGHGVTGATGSSAGTGSSASKGTGASKSTGRGTGTGAGAGTGTAEPPRPSSNSSQGTGTTSASGATSGEPRSNIGSSMRFSPIASGIPLPPRLRAPSAGSKRRLIEESGQRLLSYVEPHDPSRQPDDSDSEREDMRTEVEQAAVKFVLDSQAANWKSLEEMPPFNKGFDIRGISLDGQQYYIEVKGQSGAWTASGIAMTPSEVLCAAEHRDLYWLCVVEYALDENRRRLYIVRNPFGNAGQFRYDSGWKDIAISEKSSALVPVEGLRIEIEGDGSGTIIAVPKIGGRFTRVQVRLDDGTEIIRIFNPAKMRLSKAS
ncbi:DUF3883 domain-containing protein [Burkholderia vietnamiensis]|uniref:DUF3883 domain-containing protein n=1 Tax=Burkholderia vietnamiensis TaxID=60552 RepID=UPI001CADEE81|nr:DUF3883 domain-containing protein [Burkholderia vietnamiensis]CAG9234826.1 conserved hypothetical protein [Burkholderia vietnamiensis]